VMLGGYQALSAGEAVQKTFTNLPAHQSLRITATFTRIDALATGLMYVDGAEAWRRGFNYREGPSADSPTGSVSACGVDWHPLYNEVQVHLDVTTYHTGESATIRFEAVGSDRGGYFGVNDVQITSAVPHPSPPLPPSPPGVWESDVLFHERWPGATGWNGTSVSVTNCGSLGTMLGGYKVLLGSHGARASAVVEKTFTNLPSHHVLRIRATFTRIDALTNGMMTVDGTEAWRRDFSYLEGPSADSPLGAISACGKDWHPSYNEVQVHLDVTTYHTGESATIRFEAVGSDPGGYFGIQDVKLITGVSHP